MIKFDEDGEEESGHIQSLILVSTNDIIYTYAVVNDNKRLMRESAIE